jgi:protein-tyrosine phosphatase
VIDLHSHLLPGIDDGSSSVAQSMGVLRQFAGQGITDIVLTPHLRASDIGRRGEDMIERRNLQLEELRLNAPPGLTLHAGFEIMLDEPLPEYAVKDRRYSIAGSRYYLVEFSPSLGPSPAGGVLQRAIADGITPLVAHPERYHICQARDFAAWCEAGAVLQVDATTLTRSTSRGTMARRLVTEGLATVMAADNHGDGRSMLLGKTYLEERGGREAAHWLSTANPRAILADQPTTRVPPTPLRMHVGERVRGWIRAVAEG